MLVELIDCVISFLLSGFGDGVEWLRTNVTQVKRVWVEFVRWHVQHFILFIFLDLFDEKWSLQFDKLSLVSLKIGKLFVVDALELA